jgi:hypothetical protein
MYVLHIIILEYDINNRCFSLVGFFIANQGIYSLKHQLGAMHTHNRVEASSSPLCRVCVKYACWNLWSGCHTFYKLEELTAQDELSLRIRAESAQKRRPL